MDVALIPTQIINQDYQRLPVDIAIEKGDLKKGIDLENAILISLFTDARALDSDKTPTDYRGGWWGDEYLQTPTGSRWWLLEREGLSQTTLNKAKAMALQALQWLVNLKVVLQFNVTITARTEADGFNAYIEAVKPDFTKNTFAYSYLWKQIKDNQNGISGT